jgi:hypothetical protein
MDLDSRKVLGTGLVVVLGALAPFTTNVNPTVVFVGICTVVSVYLVVNVWEKKQ